MPFLYGLVTPTHYCYVSGLPQAFFFCCRHAPFEKDMCLTVLVIFCQYWSILINIRYLGNLIYLWGGLWGLSLLSFALHCFALHCFALLALLCIALLCIALLCIALHCFALHLFWQLSNAKAFLLTTKQCQGIFWQLSNAKAFFLTTKQCQSICLTTKQCQGIVCHN